MICFSTSFQVFSSLKEIWFMLLTGTKIILWEDSKIKFPRGKFAKAPEKSSLGLDFLNSGVCWMMSADLIKRNSPEDIPVWSLCYTFLNATIVHRLLGYKNPLGPLWVEHQSYLSIGKCSEKHHTVVITLYLSNIQSSWTLWTLWHGSYQAGLNSELDLLCLHSVLTLSPGLR